MEQINIKKTLIVFYTIFLFVSAYSVQIVQDSPIKEKANEGLRSIVITIFSIGIMGILFLLFLGGFAWVIVKIWKQFTAYARKEDFLYSVFENNLNQCHINHDSKLKKRNWRFLWVFWKKKPVYIENQKDELEVVGSYYGECLKKEGFYFMAISNKVSMFQSIEQIIVIPLSIKNKLIKKVDVEKGRTIILRCEGFDQLENTDYYLLPLIHDEKKKNSFIDFSQLVHDKFIEPTINKDIIKENLMSYRKNIIKSVESNPIVHFNRRGGFDVKK